MKRIYSIILVACLSITGIYAESLDGIRKILCKYDGNLYNTAEILRTEHNTAISEDINEVGTLYIKNANMISMVFKTKFDAMLYDKGTFTMYQKGRKRVAGDVISDQLGLIFDVFDHIKMLNDVSPLEQKAKIDILSSDSSSRITIEPIVEGKKNRRRMLYISCEIEFDMDSQCIKSMKINKRGGNYTLYTLSGCGKEPELAGEAFKF